MKKRDELSELFKKLPPEDQDALIKMAWEILLPPGSAAEFNAKCLVGVTLVSTASIILQVLGRLYVPFEFHVVAGAAEVFLLILTLVCIRGRL